MKYLKNIKNEKGVAIVFTLGILGLLTVMALGFASTALLNGKLAKNISSDSYAKSMAKNLALSQAFCTIEYVNESPWEKDFRKVYSYDADTATSPAGRPNDFLWKLNTTVNGVNLFAYPADSDPRCNVTWRYVRDTSATPQRILGRYAYVVVPDKGRLSPNIHVGRTPDANATREQYPSQVLSFRTDNESTPISSSTLSSIITPGSRTTFRCATFYDLYRKTSITNASYWFDQYGINIAPLPRSREAYMGRDGRYYERFNMNRTDWDTMTVAQLMGLNENETAVSSVNEVDFDNNTAGTQTLGYIPLLREMWQSANGDTTLQNRYKQIAANIIQYNRSPDAPTVADPNYTASTDADTIPDYMGIGRHPMLNEIGMYIRVAGGVIVSGESKNWTCTPYFNITMNVGAELVKLFSQIGNEPYQLFFYGTMSTEVEFPTGPNSGDRGTATLKLDLSPLNNTSTSEPHRFIQECTSLYTAGNNFFYLPKDNDSHALGHQIDITAGDAGANITFSGIVTPNLAGLTCTENSKLKQFIDGSESKPDYSSSLKINSVTFNLQKVVLRCNGNIRDISIFTPQSNTEKKGLPTSYYVSWQAKNPLMNLNRSGSDEWTVYVSDGSDNEEPSVDNYNSAGHGTAGSVNSDLNSCPVPDPAHGSTQLPFAFIRHASMQSFAEFACIHSGSGWDTLDLTQKSLAVNPDADDEHAEDRYPSYDRAAPPFGAIFDQVKFSSERYNYGQINLNTDSHAALFALLDYAKNNTRTGLVAASATNDIMQAGTQGGNTMGLNFCLHPTYTGASGCAACAIRTATTSQNYLFRNRSDLLLNTASLNKNNLLGYTAAYTSLSDDLPNVFNRLSSGANQTERNLLVSQIMTYLRTDPVDSAYIIVIAQSIQDVGGINTFVDWNGDGEFSTTAVDIDNALRKRLGFRYTNLSGSEADLPNAPTTINETFSPADTAVGRYDLGADKITGEAKLIAKVVRDGITGRWKIVEIRYVE